MRDRRHERDRRGGGAGRGERRLPRSADLSGRAAARRGIEVLMTLTREAIAAIDATGQLDEVLGLAEHLEDALWRVESAQASPVDATGGVIIAGMGGSASGGRLAMGALGSRLVR